VEIRFHNAYAYAVVREYGESGITALLEPATIYGLVYASSMVILHAARHQLPVPRLAAVTAYRDSLRSGAAATSKASYNLHSCRRLGPGVHGGQLAGLVSRVVAPVMHARVRGKEPAMPTPAGARPGGPLAVVLTAETITLAAGLWRLRCRDGG
jgi:hypothetical protein